MTGSIAIRVGSDIDAAEQTENVVETDCLGDEIEMKSDEETVRETDEELPEHGTQTDEEAGSIVLHVGNDMDDKEQTDTVSGAACHEDEIVMEYNREEANGAAAAKKTLQTNDGASKEDVEIRRLIEERRSTSKGEKLSKQTKMHQRQKKEQKDKKRFNEYSKTSKGSGTFQESNLQQEEEYSSPR